METADPLAIIPESHRRLTVQDYHLMIEAGVFREGDHVELLEGILVETTPQTGPHAFVIEALAGLLVRAVGPAFSVRVQLPLTVSATSEPEPDIAIVPVRTRDVAHPTTALLVIEVARGSLKRDRAVKVPLYARANVSEYWILNLDAGEIEVFRDPDPVGGRYRTSHTASGDAVLTAQSVPGLSVQISALIPR